MDVTQIRTILFYVACLAIVALFAYLLRPFFGPLFWAAVMAVLYYPVYRWTEGIVRIPNLAALITLLVIVFTLIVPLFIIGGLIFIESVDLLEGLTLDAASVMADVKDFTVRLSRHPLFTRLSIDASTIMKTIMDGTRQVISLLMGNLKSMTQDMVMFFAKFLVMLYVLFFFLRDGERFKKKVIELIPVEEDNKRVLIDKFIHTAKATLKVTVIVGGIQGLLGAIMFLVLGVKGAITWGVIMAVASIIPGVGCSIVWAPAGIILLLLGQTVKGVVVLLGGLLVISVADNLLRPLLLTHDVEMHPLMIFLASLGGIILFGIMGFVLGPIIASLFLALLDMYYYRHDCTD